MLAELLLGRLVTTSADDGSLATNPKKTHPVVKDCKDSQDALGSWVEGCLQQTPARRPLAEALEQGLAKVVNLLSAVDIVDAPAPAPQHTAHLALYCSQRLNATYLPADASDPRYKGVRTDADQRHPHYVADMHADGAGAPFPLQ